jgi:hypothetical protein
MSVLVTQEKKQLMEKLKTGSDDNFASQVLQELKSQITSEQRKLTLVSYTNIQI